MISYEKATAPIARISNRSNTVFLLVAGLATVAFLIIWLAPESYSNLVLPDYATWHALAECLSVAVSIGIFFVVWQTYHSEALQIRLAIISMAFLAVGVLDIFHLLSIKNMPTWITPSGNGKGIPFWLFARAAAAGAILLFVWPNRKITSIKPALPILLALTLFYIAVPTVLTLSSPTFQSLFLIPGQGPSTLKVLIEWAVILTLVAALVVNIYLQKPAIYYEPRSLSLAIYLTILSELSFTLYSNVNSIFAAFGHILKIAAYFSLYQSIVIRNLELPYQKLKANQSLLEQITNTIKQVFILTSVDRNKVLYVSPAYEELTGRTRESLIENPASRFEYVHPDDVEVVTSWHNNASKEESVHEYRITHSNGEQKWISEHVYPVKQDSGSIYRFASVCADITVRKVAELEKAHLEEQLIKTQKMEAIGHLVGGFAHDFNNILGVMIGFSELLREYLVNPVAYMSEIDNCNLQVITAGQRAKEIISQMLVFSRLNPDLNDGTSNATSVKPIIKEIVKLLESTIASYISVDYEQSDDDLIVGIHPVQLHQTLLNLAINSRDATEGFGKISIRVDQSFDHDKCTSCSNEFEGDFVKITLEDNGVGIKPDVIKNIFDPFFTTKELGKGSGLGLSVIHGIVHSAGGHIRVESKLRVGTKFHIYLPNIKQKSELERIAENTSEYAKDISVLKDMRIMIVDDHVVNTNLFSTFLSKYSPNITVFNNPLDALATFETTPESFDLILTDETMPNMSGLEMSVKMLEKRNNLPIIMCTGFSERVNAKIAGENGLAGFMLKPVHLHELVDLIVHVTHKMKNQRAIN